MLECHWRGLLQAANLKSWVCFALQNPLTSNPLLLCFTVTPAWLLLDFAAVELRKLTDETEPFPGNLSP